MTSFATRLAKAEQNAYAVIEATGTAWLPRTIWSG